MNVSITGSSGRIQGVFHQGSHDDMALILHGDSENGGHMDDRITYALFLAFKRQGFSVLRFNFRGTGLSQGKIEELEEDILSDASSALDWLKNQSHELQQKIWLAGIDHGAYAGMQLLMRRPEVERFISINPSVDTFDFSFLSPCPCSGLIIHPEKGHEMKGIKRRSMASRLNEQGDIHARFEIIPDADTKYTHTLKKLYQVVEDYIVTERGKETRLM
ncbi:MAG: alpha/beta hydrolase [Alphaproteobacteria bacterium]|nr:alpha/beta hydrolase [Alphaproteobacteria bacterium]